MGAGADSATAAAALETAIPERRHAASTSRLAAAASVSSTTVGRRRLPAGCRRTRTLTADTWGRTRAAAARSTAAQVM